jgi:hypothetical protein
VCSQENPLPEILAARFGNRFCAFLACFCQRREHDRQPATGVVVMPVPMMDAIGRKHRPRLIPDSPEPCQTFRQDLQDFSELTRILFIMEIL